MVAARDRAELRWDQGRGRSEVLDNVPSGGWVEIKLTRNARSFHVARGPGRPTCRIRSTPASAACKISSWYSPSNYALEFVAEKSLAVSEYGRVLMSKWAPGTARRKVRSKWIRSSRSVFRISLQSWLANRVSLVSSICSRLRSMVRVKISIWFGSTTCLHALSGPVNASLPEEVYC